MRNPLPPIGWSPPPPRKPESFHNLGPLRLCEVNGGGGILKEALIPSPLKMVPSSVNLSRTVILCTLYGFCRLGAICYLLQRPMIL